MSIKLKLKFMEIIEKKVASFPNNPRGFKEYEAYFKSHNVAVWGFYKGIKKYSRRKWEPIVDVPETFSKDTRLEVSKVCVVHINEEIYYLPADFAEKVLVLGSLP